MMAAAPLCFPDMFAAPSYAWPMQYSIHSPASFTAVSTASATYSPTINSVLHKNKVGRQKPEKMVETFFDQETLIAIYL
jgi:hypothetical protein